MKVVLMLRDVKRSGAEETRDSCSVVEVSQGAESGGSSSAPAGHVPLAGACVHPWKQRRATMPRCHRLLHLHP